MTDTDKLTALDRQSALCHRMLDEMIGDVVEALDEADSPDVLAAELAVSFDVLDPHGAATLAGFALVRLARHRREFGA